MPVRIFVSPQDRVVDTQAIRKYYEQLGSTDKKLIEAENSGHAIPVDHDWKTVVEEIEKFSNELLENRD